MPLEASQHAEPAAGDPAPRAELGTPPGGAHEAAGSTLLASDHALFSSLIENTTDGVLIETEDRRVFAVNSAFCRVFQIDANPATLPGADCAAVTAAAQALVQDPAAFEPRMRQLLQERRPVAGEEVSFADGRVFERDYVPVGSAGAGFTGHLWRYREITQRKSAEQRLRFLAEASRLLASSLDYDATIDSVVRLTVPSLADICALDLLDDNGGIQRMKLAAADEGQRELLEDLRRRYPPSWDSPQPTAEVLRAARPVLLADIDDDVAAAHTRGAEHLRLIRATGLRSQLAVPLIARGRLLGVLSLCFTSSGRRFHERDVEFATELAQRIAAAVDNAALYRATERADRAKADFLAVMSHELRTPINAVIGYADLWLAGLPEPLSPRMRTQVERVAWSAQHLRDLIEDVLTFSRVDAGKEEMHPQSVRLGAVVDSVVALIEPLALQRKLTFRAHVAAPDTLLFTDAGKLRQILVNLLSNAVKFTREGSVALDVEEAGDEVRFVVTDSGIGIAAEHLDRVFEPFWQVEQASTHVVGGTGLGLAVARRLAALLRGELTAASTPGRGSTFILRLPLA